ncbi:MAG TPA: hypothetical protein VGR30_06730 [Candidatus Binatia bacterium]|nr:hypothetical protein [Candidatus Binatia bacterium]
MDDFNFNGHVEGVSRLYQQLDEKIAERGGLGNLFGLRSKLREGLDAINSSELDTLLNEIHRTREALNQLQEEVIELRFLKEVFSSAAASRMNAGLKS